MGIKLFWSGNELSWIESDRGDTFDGEICEITKKKRKKILHDRRETEFFKFLSVGALA